MKALVSTQYGPPEVLQLQEVEIPAPKDDEVLIKIRAASLNAYDWHMLRADLFPVRLAAGLFKPRNTRPGADVAGQVEAVGRNVTKFRPGDEVFGDIAASGCGGFAEYACARETLLAVMPLNLTFEEAAAVPMAALTALQGLRDAGQIHPGKKVLIQGASGGVGTFAVQFARFFGADVTAVCSPANLEQARVLGAEHVIDYTQEDFTRSGQYYDLIFAANGYHSIFQYRRALAPSGIYVMAGGCLSQILQALLFGPWLSRSGRNKMVVLTTRASQKDLVFIKELLEKRQVRAVVDRRYPLSQAADAYRYLGEGHARGKIVLTIDQDKA